MRKLFLFLIGILFFLPCTVFASDITQSSSILLNEITIDKNVTDGIEKTYIKIPKDSFIEITNEEDIHGLYIIYELRSQKGNISNDVKSEEIGQNGFLHEYINVENILGLSKEVTLSYEEDVNIADIYVLGEGELPEYVELWEPSHDKADLLILPTHSDDEQLFLLGVIPTYIAQGAKVQVAYYTIHYNNTIRLHEQLHGLYTVGVRNYPIIGIVPDYYSTSLNGALNNLKRFGLTEEDTLKFTVDLLRKFQPQVVVGHDELGEYGHGQHLLNTYILEKALELSNDETYNPESYEIYGGWNVPKTYLHLYKKNQIIMNYDIPLDYFDGQTAFEISRYAFTKHVSQQGSTYVPWLNNVNKASEITKYSPVEYGLYRSLVGDDINKNDMFENLKFRKDEIVDDDTPNEDITDEIQGIDSNFLIDNKKYIIPVLLIISLLIAIIITAYKKELWVTKK